MLNGKFKNIDVKFDTILDEVVQSLVAPKTIQSKLVVDLIADIGSGGRLPSAAVIQHRYSQRQDAFLKRSELQLCDLSTTFNKAWTILKQQLATASTYKGLGAFLAVPHA